MKLRFIEAPKGRDFKVGDVVEFNTSIEHSYARKYIARGWAEEIKAEPTAVTAELAAEIPLDLPVEQPPVRKSRQSRLGGSDQS